MIATNVENQDEIVHYTKSVCVYVGAVGFFIGWITVDNALSRSLICLMSLGLALLYTLFATIYPHYSL